MSNPSEDRAVVDVLRAALAVTGMAAAYLAEFEAGEQILRCVIGEGFDFQVGQRTPLEETLCQRMIDGRLGRAVPDTHADARTVDLAVTERTGIRGYLGVPVRLPDGRLYGSVCCIDREARPEISERDADILQSLGGLLGNHSHGGREAERLVRERDELLASSHTTCARH